MTADLVRVRKIVVHAEEIRHEGGPPPNAPRRIGAVAGVVANPYAGRYVADIAPFMEALKPLGLEMTRRLIDALGGDPKAIEAGQAEWSRQMQLLEAHLAANGPYVTGPSFTVGDIPIGLTVNRWFGIPFAKPELKAVSAYYDRLAERPGFKKHGRNGTP